MPDPTSANLARAREIDLEWRAANAWPGMTWSEGSRPALALDAVAAERDAVIAAMGAALRGTAVYGTSPLCWCEPERLEGAGQHADFCLAATAALALTPEAVREPSELAQPQV